MLKYCSRGGSRGLDMRTLLSRFAASESGGGDLSAPELPYRAHSNKSGSPGDCRLGDTDQALEGLVVPLEERFRDQACLEHPLSLNP